MAGIDKTYIGRHSAPITLEVERGHIRRFAEAIGDDDPIYRDEAAARAAGYSTIPAPPTFATALRPADVREGIAIDWKKLLHGEQRYLYQRPLMAGDRVTLVQTIKDIYEKQGRSGVMDFIVMETTAHDERRELVYTAISSAVIKR